MKLGPITVPNPNSCLLDFHVKRIHLKMSKNTHRKLFEPYDADENKKNQYAFPGLCSLEN